MESIEISRNCLCNVIYVNRKHELRNIVMYIV